MGTNKCDWLIEVKDRFHSEYDVDRYKLCDKTEKEAKETIRQWVESWIDYDAAECKDDFMIQETKVAGALYCGGIKANKVTYSVLAISFTDLMEVNEKGE